MNIQDEESVFECQMVIDNLVQFDENRMPSDKHFNDMQEMPDGVDMMGAAAEMDLWLINRFNANFKFNSELNKSNFLNFLSRSYL